jgi:hypothetical protein
LELGVPGPTGATGATGAGVPVGGTTGQVLAKIDGTNYNTEWVNVEGDYLPLAGGAMDAGAEVTIADGSNYDSELAGWGLGVELSSDHAQGTTVEYNGLHVYNGIDTINVIPTGINLTNNDTSKHTNITTSYINVTDDNNSLNVQLTDGTIILTNGGTDSVLSINSNTGITFDDTTVQNTAFPGFAGFAPIASPAFTGNPTAPTPATSDNDTSIATTAYVKAQAFGDRYLTTSTTSNTISNTTKTFTIGTGLSYTPTQNITISYDAANHMHGEVLTYNSGTGVLTVDVNHHTGSGTYASWVVNVGGVTPATSVAFSDITGAVSGNVNLQAALDLKANLASPSLTGTPLSTTASVSTNTTQIATTAFVLGQVGTATPIVDGTAAVGTSLLYARQDHVHGTDTTRAALASPSFSGTPSLPTGTTGITQSPGNNTTALATTAFVTAAVPVNATDAQARQGLSETVVSSPYDVITAMMIPGYRPNLVFVTTTSGTGASVGNSASAYVQCIGPNASTAGYAIAYTNQFLGLSAGYANTKLDFSKPIRLGGSVDNFSSTYIGDANNEMKIWLGQANALPPTNYADPTSAAIGWKKTGGTASTFTLMVHNGTTLTTQSSSATLSVGLVADWEIRSDGAGNVALFINGTSVATTSAGPTSVQSNVCTLQVAVGQTASAATRILIDATYTKIWVAPQS